MPTWRDITRNPDYQALSEQDKAYTKQEFFNRNIASDERFQQLNENDKNVAFVEFMNLPDDTGQGFVTSMAGAVARGFGEVGPGTVEGVGALTGIQPLREFGQTMREGLEYIAPVNPIYAEGIPAQVANVAGNVGSIIATGGVGGAIGRGLAAERIAAAGTQAAKQAATLQAIQAGARPAVLGTGFAQGAAGKARENEQLGITGPEAYLNILGGGLAQTLPEVLPFGTALETAAARRLLGGADEAGRVIPGVRMSAAQEGVEGAASQVLSNISTQLAAPEGVQTPGIFEGVGEAALWESVGGGMFGVINKLGRTPPERQTPQQQQAAAEFNASPVDQKPDITPEESLQNAQQGGIPVVPPDGEVAWLPAMREAITQPAIQGPTQPSAVEQRLQTAISLAETAAANPEASQAAAAAAQVINEVAQTAPIETPPTPKPKRGKKIQPIADLAAQTAAKLRGEAPQDISAGLQAAIPPSLPETGPPVVDQEAPAVTTVQAAPIQPENLQSALDAHTSGPKTPEQDWQFASSMPEGVWIEDGMGARMRKKSQRIKKSGSEEIEFEHQVFNEETGKWEDNPSAYVFMSKKKDGSLAVNNQFPSPLRPASYTDISTGERKISKPVVVLPSPKPTETQEDAAPEIPLEESVREEPQDRIESRTPEEAGVGDQLLRPATGEEEVAPNALAAAKARNVTFVEPPNEFVERAWREGVPGERDGFVSFEDTYVIDPRQLPEGAIVGEDFSSYALPNSEGLWRTFFMDVDGSVRVSPVLTPDLEAAIAAKQTQQPPSPTKGAKPTPTTEGMVTPGGVAAGRDLTKPEQMTLDEATERVWPRNKNTQNAPRSGEANLNGMSAIKKAGGWMFTHPTLGRMPVLSPSEVNRLDHQLIIQKALTQRKPVAVEPVDWYDITLPEGYVKQGDLYVFTQPESPIQTGSRTGSTRPERGEERGETKALETQGRSVSGLGEYVSDDAAMLALDLVNKPESLKVMNPSFVDEVRPLADMLGRHPDEVQAIMGFPFSSRPNLVKIVLGLPIDAGSMSPAQIQSYSEMFGAFKNAKNYSRQGDLYVFQPQTTAAEKQTPVPLREGTGAAGVVQSEPVEGSIPTVAEVSPETETTSTEKADVVSAAMADLNGKILELPESAQKKWTPEVLQKAQDYYASTDRSWSRLDGLTQTQKERVQDALYRADKEEAKRQREVERAQKTITREMAKEESEARKREEKRLQEEDETRKALRSLISSERTNTVIGNVKSSDAAQAVQMLNNSGEVPNVAFTRIFASGKDFLADANNEVLFPDSYRALQQSTDYEGLFENGTPLIFLDQIGVSDLDRRLSRIQGVTPEVAAVRRVIVHENYHKGIFWLKGPDYAAVMNLLRRIYTPDVLDQLAKKYTEYADWRINPKSYVDLLEEMLMKDVDSMASIPTEGLWGEFFALMKRIWNKITGKKGDPTLKDLKDVIRLVRKALKENGTKAPTLKDGGGVKLSMIAPTVGITPEMDAEYMAAVEAGDMEKAQRMVDEAAKAAGYETEAYHGSKEEFNVFKNQQTAYGFFFAPDKRTAEFYGPAKKFYLKTANMADFTDPADFSKVAEEAIWSDTKTRSEEKVKEWIDSAVIDTSGGRSFAAKVLDLTDEQMAEYESFNDILRDLKKEWEQVVEVVEEEYPQALASLDKAAPAFNEEVENARRAHDDLEQSWYMNYQDDFVAAAQTLGYDSVFMQDQAGSTGGSPESFVVFNPSQIKSADPVTRDDAGNVIPLSQRFQPESPDIRFSKVDFSTPSDALLNTGSEVSRDTLYDARIIGIRNAIRQAYEAMPKTNSVAVPIGELLSKTQEFAPDVTADEFSNVLQDMFEDNGAVLQEGNVAEPLTEQDRRYLALAENEEANREELQRMVDAAARAAVLQRAAVLSRKYGMPVGLRYGELPEDNISTGIRPSGRLVQEKGLSVYGVVGRKGVQLTREANTFGDTRVSVLDRPAFLVVGKESGHRGGNTEPLFTDIVHSEEIDNALVAPLAQEMKGPPFIGRFRFPPPVTRDDAGRIIPLSRRFDTGADIRGQINVTTPEGRQAGFVVVMPSQNKEYGIISRSSGEIPQTVGGGIYQVLPESDTSPRAQTIRKAAAIENWNELDANARNTALSDFAASVSPSFIQSADSLGIRFTTGRTNAGRSYVTYAGSPVGGVYPIDVVFDFGSVAGRSNDPTLLFTFAYDTANEEVIHAIQKYNTQRRFIESGGTGNPSLFEMDYYNRMLMEVIDSTEGNPEALKRVSNAILKSVNSYYGKNYTNTNEALASLRDAPTMAAYMMELSRQLVQVSRDDFTSETGYMRFFEAFKRIINDILEALRGLLGMVQSGDVGQLIQREINDINGLMRDMRSGGIKASKVDPENAAAKRLKEDADAASAGSVRANFGGVPFVDYEGTSHITKTKKSYEEAAVRFVDDLVDQGISIDDIADSVMSPAFLERVGIKDDLAMINSVVFETRNRIVNTMRKTRDAALRKRLERKHDDISAFSQGVRSTQGQNFALLQQLMQSPRYRWQFIYEMARKQQKQDVQNVVAQNVTNPDELKAGVDADAQASADAATEQNVQAAENATGTQEDVDDDADLRAGEATLSEKLKQMYEELKDWLRTKGIIARARAERAANAAKPSISAERRSAIMSMTDEELDALDKEADKNIDRILKTILGKEEDAKTPEQKATRQKRKKMVDVAKKRAEQGKDIEFTRVSVQTFMDSLMADYPDRKSIVDEVGDSLLKAAQQRKAKPKQITAIQQLVASIKQNLMANLKGDAVKPEQPSLGILLGKVFAQKGSEAELFEASWQDGRKKVREMLAGMGVDEADLDAELNAIMPPTPMLAYAPAAAKKAVNMAMSQAGLMRSDLLNDPQNAKKAIMVEFDKAAASANLTEEGWANYGRALADKAVDETITQAKQAQERAKQIAQIVAEQSRVKLPLNEFSEKLAKFNLKKDKIQELFNRASRLTLRRAKIADDRALRIILSKEIRLAESVFPGKEKDGDTLVRAFKEQVEEPMSEADFKNRVAKLDVSPEMADRMFKKAEKERLDQQWMQAYNFLEGPDALSNMLRELNRARPGEQAPLSKQIPWRTILSQKASTVAEYRQRIFDVVASNEAFANLTDEQKQRFADVFAQAWEQNRTRILDSMLENRIRQERARNNLTKAGAEALQKQRMKLVEDLNLGILDNEQLMIRLAEKFGIKAEYTEQEREQIDKLLDILQDEKTNAALRASTASKLLSILSDVTKVPIAKIIADFWVASVLNGFNTIFSIGAAVASGAFELLSGFSRVIRTGFQNPQEVPGAIVDSFKAFRNMLAAFPMAARASWQYLVTGDRLFLDPSMNDITKDLNYEQIGRTTALAENLAKSENKLAKVVGLYMRTVSRLLTALDNFNSTSTKFGSLPIVFRSLKLTPEKLAQLQEKHNLQMYIERVIRNDFNGVQPKNMNERATVEAYARAEMMKDLDELGRVSENADFYGMQGAFTLDPTGIGGAIYKGLRDFTGGMSKSADNYIAAAKRRWQIKEDPVLDFINLASAYFMQFIAYNASNMAGFRFARFAGNKFNQGLSFIPGIGMLRKFEADSEKNPIRGKEAFIDMIDRNQMAGMALAVIGYVLLEAIADEPDDEKRGWAINGGWGNLTPEKKKQLLAAGMKEYTIRIGDKVYNYINWPISSALAAIGGLSDLIRFSPEAWDEKDVVSRLGTAAASGIFAATDIPALSTVQELFGSNLSSKDPVANKLDRLARVMSGYAGGFVPRILKDFDYLAEPGLRKYKTLWEKTASHIPVYRRHVGEEYYDILGRQIERKVYPGSREFLAQPTEPEYRILGALNSRGIWLTPANAEHRMVGRGSRKRNLTQEEADAYSLETGRGYRQMLLKYGQRALRMPPERAQAFLQDLADDVRDRALMRVYRGYRPAE